MLNQTPLSFLEDPIDVRNARTQQMAGVDNNCFPRRGPDRQILPIIGGIIERLCPEDAHQPVPFGFTCQICNAITGENQIENPQMIGYLLGIFMSAAVARTMDRPWPRCAFR
jgi:hypothetical protein